MNRLVRSWNTWGMAGVLVVILLVGALVSPGFLGILNLQSVLRESAYLGIVACAMTIAIMSGSFDLSVGAQLALVSVVTLFAYGAAGTALAVPAAVATGAACGVVNAVLIVVLRVPPFVATLGTLFVFRGLAYLLTSDGPATLPYSEAGSAFVLLGNGDLAFVPFPFLLMIAFYAAAWVFLRRTATGRRIVAHGSSPRAARFAGISAAGTSFTVFVLLGTAVGIATLAYITRVWTADGATQDGFELRAITAAVLGGASLLGGRGSLLGTFCAVLALAALNDLLAELGVEASYQRIVLGAVLIAALGADGLGRRLRSRPRRHVPTTA